MLTNEETRTIVKKMHSCGIKYVQLADNSGIDRKQMYSFVTYGNNLPFDVLILLLLEIQLCYPYFLKEVDDNTDYIPIVLKRWLNIEDN